jgi:hypothetical protein
MCAAISQRRTLLGAYSEKFRLLIVRRSSLAGLMPALNAARMAFTCPRVKEIVTKPQAAEQIGHGRPQASPRLCSVVEHRLSHALQTTSSIADQPLHQTKTKLLPSRPITASARTSRFQRFRHRATCAQTNSRAPSIVLIQFDDLWSPSAFRRARDRRSSCRILACHLVVHAKLHVSCGAHPR